MRWAKCAPPARRGPPRSAGRQRRSPPCTSMLVPARGRGSLDLGDVLGIVDADADLGSPASAAKRVELARARHLVGNEHVARCRRPPSSRPRTPSGSTRRPRRAPPAGAQRRATCGSWRAGAGARRLDRAKSAMRCRLRSKASRSMIRAGVSTSASGMPGAAGGWGTSATPLHDQNHCDVATAGKGRRQATPKQAARQAPPWRRCLRPLSPSQLSAAALASTTSAIKSCCLPASCLRSSRCHAGRT